MTGKNKFYLGKLTKKPANIFNELNQWVFAGNDLNTMYYAYGLNEAGTSQSDFIGTREYLDIKHKTETKLVKRYGKHDLNYDILTKDKFVANSFLQANNIPCIPHLGIIAKGKFIDRDNQLQDLNALTDKYQDIILKNLTLEAGEGVLALTMNEKGMNINNTACSSNELNNKLKSGIWLVQPRMKSHEAIRKINSTALNTTRIVTILDGDEPVYLTGFQALATGNQTTDSWSKGSIYVGIDVEKQCLKKYGYYNLSIPDKSIALEHPDSHIPFEGYSIPYMKDAIELCTKAHRLLFFNFLVGWDVAITDEGPIIVEANEKPGMNIVQAMDGGLKAKISQYASHTS